MKKTILVLILLGMFVNVFPQSYDVKYTAEYVLKDAGGNEKSRMKYYRNGDKLKFQKVDNRGKADESTTDIYIFKDDPNVYTIVTNSAGKFGSKYARDVISIFMQTGVFIFDLGNVSTVFNNNTRVGSGTVLGKECVKYTVASNGEVSSDYYIYQDNLMLKRSVGNAVIGNTIEAITYDITSEVPESMFVVPTDVKYY